MAVSDIFLFTDFELFIEFPLWFRVVITSPRCCGRTVRSSRRLKENY